MSYWIDIPNVKIKFKPDMLGRIEDLEEEVEKLKEKKQLPHITNIRDLQTGGV